MGSKSYKIVQGMQTRITAIIHLYPPHITAVQHYKQ